MDQWHHCFVATESRWPGDLSVGRLVGLGRDVYESSYAVLVDRRIVRVVSTLKVDVNLVPRRVDETVSVEVEEDPVWTRQEVRTAVAELFLGEFCWIHGVVLAGESGCLLADVNQPAFGLLGHVHDLVEAVLPAHWAQEF